MISINNFGISFGKNRILENVSFDVKQGEIVSLLGSSGCGKTTILRAIAGLQKEHEGHICIGDVCVSSKEVFIRNREIGYIFQDYALFPHLNVEENIAFALDNLDKNEKKSRVSNLLKQFDLEEHSKKSIHQLSGGQQQRVAIARAMANNPKILLLDEPFANLDTNLRNKTKNWLKNLIKTNNLSAILVTHDKKEALSISDKIGIIHNKTLQQFDDTLNIYKNPKNYFIANFLLDINTLPNELIKSIDLKITNNQIAIIDINQCTINLSENDEDLNVEIINKYFCGDHFELEIKLIKYNHFLTIKTSQNIKYDVKYSLIFDKNNVKIIDN